MIEHLPFNALRAFEAAARHLSFRAAAQELHVTPAAISQQIKTLEDLLEVQLFHRFNRRLALTPAAQQALPKLREGLTQCVEAVNEIRNWRDNADLTIWMAPSFASKWFIPRLPRFTARYPGIDLNISASPDLIDDGEARDTIPAKNFRQQNIDLAIRFGKGHYPGCKVDKLFSVSVVPLCSPCLLNGTYPLKQPENLRNHTLIHDNTLYEGRPDWASWLKAANVKGVDASHGLRFNHIALALQAAIDGQGVVLSLYPLAADDLAAGRLVIPFDLSLPLNYAYYVISLEEKAQQTNIAVFRDWLLNEAAGN